VGISSLSAAIRSAGFAADFYGGRFYGGTAAAFMSGEKFLNFFQKGVDFFGKFAYNTM
jgi:hypothetical protein